MVISAAKAVLMVELMPRVSDGNGSAQLAAQINIHHAQRSRWIEPQRLDMTRGKWNKSTPNCSYSQKTRPNEYLARE